MDDVIVIVLALVLLAFGLAHRFLLRSHARASQQTVQEKIDSGALVVDVRTPSEFAAGHYDGAVNIPVDEIEERASELRRADAPIVLYCNSGNRTARAHKTLKRLGFQDVLDAGGLRDMPGR
jgi:phage shock protein E